MNSHLKFQTMIFAFNFFWTKQIYQRQCHCGATYANVVLHVKLQKHPFTFENKC